MTRIMWLLLAVVAGAAAVLSFAALRDLAALCGFAPGLAWLLPVVIDAGAAAGCLAWLGPDPGERARRFARALTVVLLAGSVAGNAVVHGLSAYRLAAPWWLVVAVSAVAPAVLGAVAHLAVLVAQDRSAGPERDAAAPGDADPGEDTRADTLIAAGVGRRALARELDISEHAARRLLAARDGVAR